MKYKKGVDLTTADALSRFYQEDIKKEKAKTVKDASKVVIIEQGRRGGKELNMIIKLVRNSIGVMFEEYQEKKGGEVLH